MQVKKAAFEELLCNGEKLLWCGEFQSGGGFSADRKIAFTSNLWAIPLFILFVIVSELTLPFGLKHKIISLVFILVLCEALFAVGIRYNISARGSRYAITDRRVIIIDGTSGKLYSAMLWEISGITLKCGKNNIGCVRYMVNGERKVESKSKWADFSGKAFKTDYYGLYGIANPQEVYQILKNAVSKINDTGGI